PELLRLAARALGKRVRDVVVITLDRPRHADIVRAVRETGAGLRMIGDGDITAAVARQGGGGPRPVGPRPVSATPLADPGGRGGAGRSDRRPGAGTQVL